MPSSRRTESYAVPPRREDLGLLQDGLHGGVLKVRRIAVLSENALDQNPYARPR